MISGFEEYRFPWAMNVAALPMPGGIITSYGVAPFMKLTHHQPLRAEPPVISGSALSKTRRTWPGST